MKDLKDFSAKKPRIRFGVRREASFHLIKETPKLRKETLIKELDKLIKSL